MEQPQNEGIALATKILTYVFGISIGLAAKLTLMHKQGKLSIEEMVYRTVVALACAYLIWQLLSYYNVNENIRQGASVIVGRFGDEILMAIWEVIKKSVNNAEHNLMK